jgi:predicted Zn-dependent protease
MSTGAPNACNQCHTDRSADWAYSALVDWGVRFADRRNHPARAFHAAGRGDVRAAPVLLETANNTKNSPMLRASAITQLGRLLPERLMPSLPLWLESDDPLIRMAAAEAALQLPPEQQLERVLPLSEDPLLAVRMVAAEQLAGLMPPKARRLTPAKSKSSGQQANVEEQPEAADPLDALFAEYVHVQSQHLDMPSVLTQLSGFQQARGDAEGAEALLVAALKKNPQASASRVNLVDLYRAQGKEEAARATLERGVELNQEDASLWFSLALLEVRGGNGEAALAALETAASLEETPSYYHYVYAIAQHDQGRPEEAIKTLKAANRAAPGQPNVIAALMQYSQLAGDMQAAQRYQTELRNTAQAAGVQ